MNTCRLILMVVSLLAGIVTSQAQTLFRQNATQKKYLIQQILKLQIYLEYTKRGYNIMSKGLNTMSSIKSGDYQLHELFFGNLSKVKPVINGYSKVEAIKSDILIIRSIAGKVNDLVFNNDMLVESHEEYIRKQVDNMLQQLLDDMTSLNSVLSDNSLQMSDDDRIKRIDKVYQSVSDKKQWVIQLYDDCKLLILQRLKGINYLKTLQQIYPSKSK